MENCPSGLSAEVLTLRQPSEPDKRSELPPCLTVIISSKTSFVQQHRNNNNNISNLFGKNIKITAPRWQLSLIKVFPLNQVWAGLFMYEMCGRCLGPEFENKKRHNCEIGRNLQMNLLHARLPHKENLSRLRTAEWFYPYSWSPFPPA